MDLALKHGAMKHKILLEQLHSNLKGIQEGDSEALQRIRNLLFDCNEPLIQTAPSEVIAILESFVQTDEISGVDLWRIRLVCSLLMEVQSRTGQHTDEWLK